MVFTRINISHIFWTSQVKCLTAMLPTMVTGRKDIEISSFKCSVFIFFVLILHVYKINFNLWYSVFEIGALRLAWTVAIFSPRLTCFSKFTVFVIINFQHLSFNIDWAKNYIGTINNIIWVEYFWNKMSNCSFLCIFIWNS